MIIEEEVYLQHFGTKGMKWGVRREQRRQAYKAHETRRHMQGKLTGWERAGAIAGGYGISQIATTLAFMGTRNLQIAKMVALPSAVAGGLWLRKVMIREGQTKLSAVKRRNEANKVDEDSVRKLEEFISKNKSAKP